MDYKTHEIRKSSNKWYCKIIYEDGEGFRVIYEKNGFKTKLEAHKHCMSKRQEIEK